MEKIPHELIHEEELQRPEVELVTTETFLLHTARVSKQADGQQTPN